MAFKRVEPSMPHDRARGREAVRKKVLYVEDDDTNWEVADLALRDEYTLVRATGAKDTFEVLSREQFDVILMDIELKGSDLDGIQITRELKAKKAGRCDAPVVFMTAYDGRYRREELLDAGAVDTMPKPVNFTKLALLLTRVMTRAITGTSS